MDFIDGFAFRGYRSFPSGRSAELYPLSKINLVAGQNNAGKSNILRVIASTFSANRADESAWDRPVGDAEHRYARSIYYSLDTILSWHGPLDRHVERMLRKFLGLVCDATGLFDGIYWPIVSAGKTDSDRVRSLAVQVGSPGIATDLSRILVNRYGGGGSEDTYRVLDWLMRKRPDVPHAVVISGNRSISNEDTALPDLNGRSIKSRLQQLQSPATERLPDRQTFEQFQQFVRTVLDDPTLTIDIPFNLSTIHVTQNGRTLPVENMGTGVHEVVIIAAAATVTSDSIVCIEEPEVHLHPILQRKLLRYLSNATTNQ